MEVHGRSVGSLVSFSLKVQVRLAEAEAQRDRQQLELQLGTSEMKGITVNGLTPWMIGTAVPKDMIFDSMTLDDRMPRWRRLQWQQEALSEEFSNALQKALSNCPAWIQPMKNLKIKAIPVF